MADPNVLVTGSSGHLGSALMLDLPNHGFSPVGFDILESELTSIVGSITDRDLVSEIFERHPSLRYVLHTATLHKPHVESHSKEGFIQTNIQGTLVLLEEASRIGTIEAFIFTSTTSAYGNALSSKQGEPATWIDETVTPIPRNIYGVTKIAAEDICQLIYNETKMPILVLKASRFFPEPDDDETGRLAFDDENLKVCELLNRRVDIADLVTAQVCAMRQAKRISWAKYIITAPTPIGSKNTATLQALGEQPLGEIEKACPHHAKLLLEHGWQFPVRLDRIYDSSKAVRELSWKPQYTFQRAVEHVHAGKDWRSDLAAKIGKRGYHAQPTGVYTAAESSC